jgi:hypothetical protein
LTEWLGLTVASIKALVDNDWNEKGAAATGQGIMGMLGCCEGILKGQKKALFRQTSVIYFFKTSWKFLHPKLSFVCHFILFCKFYISRNTYFVFIQVNHLGPTS